MFFDRDDGHVELWKLTLIKLVRVQLQKITSSGTIQFLNSVRQKKNTTKKLPQFDTCISNITNTFS